MWQAELLNTIIGSFSSGVVTPATSYESIATVTVGSGGSASIDFTSIPATYTHLQIRFTLATGNASDGNFIVQFNNDTTSANYVRHYLIGDGSTVNASGGDNTSAVAYNPGGTYPGVAVIDILDYTNTNKNKVVRSLAGQDSNGSGFVFYTSVMYMSLTAISSIKLKYASQNAPQHSQFALYGVKS